LKRNTNKRKEIEILLNKNSVRPGDWKGTLWKTSWWARKGGGLSEKNFVTKAPRTEEHGYFRDNASSPYFRFLAVGGTGGGGVYHQKFAGPGKSPPVRQLWEGVLLKTKKRNP